MSLRKIFSVAAAAVAVLGVFPATVSAADPSRFFSAIDAMMSSLAPESARDGAKIRGVYQEYLELLMLNGYVDIEGALDNGGLVPLPADPLRYNLQPRLDGPHPIGEKDLGNQSSYIAARPATIGVLLEIASRVKSGPLEITSLVRHGEYQQSLRATNTNATTSVPMHTMGLAVDIALVNSSLETVYEIRDALRTMQRHGDILFVGERRQLVFHVVPHPSRLGYFTDVYIRKVGLPPTSRSAHVVAAGLAPAVRSRSAGVPRVTSEVLNFLPLYEPSDVHAVAFAADADSVAPPAAAMSTAMRSAAASAGRMLRRWGLLALALLLVGWRIAVPPDLRPCLVKLRS